MKNKLFAVAGVLFFYFIFVFVFSMADKEGHISKLAMKVGLSEASAMTSPSIIQFDDFIDPTPDPTIPRPKPTFLNNIDPTPDPTIPRPKPTALNNIDPTPDPTIPRPKPTFLNNIDPTPDPTIPRPKPTSLAMSNFNNIWLN